MKFRKFCRKIKYKKKITLSVVVLFLVSLMSIGFAYMSQKLDVKATVNVFNGFSVRISDIVVSDTTSSGTTEYNPNYSKTTAGVTTTLPNLDSTVTYQITFKNYSTDMVAELESIKEESISSDLIEYTLSIKEGDLIDADGTSVVNLIIKYKDGINLPDDTNFGVSLTFNFKVHEEKVDADYINDGLILNLKETDEVVDNVWYDNTNGYAMKLTNVIYDADKKKYDFSSSGSYATLGKSLIPETGDFTLEAYIETPKTINASGDEAVVSQVSDTTNDNGRFKMNLQKGKLLVFLNRQNPNNTNMFYYFSDSINASSKYLMQVVRTGDQLNLYLNGSLVVSNSYTSSNKISQGPFKLGKWNNAALQAFTGSYHAVRLYNRALTNEELIKNRDSDTAIYVEKKKEYHTIKEYAEAEHISDNGGSLYIDNLGRYVYRGSDPTNYVKLPGSDDLYRILYFNNEDSTMKLINVSTRYNKSFDETGNRNSTDSTYCNKASTVADATNKINFGCNAWASDDNFSNGVVTGTVANDATINTFLNNEYYDSLVTEVKGKIINHNFDVGVGKTSGYRDSQNTQSLTKTWKGNVGLITLSDVLNANINSVNVSNNSVTLSNYLTTMVGGNEVYWTMTPSAADTYDVYSVLAGSVSHRRGSRSFQVDGSKNLLFYVIPSFYVSSNAMFTGTGIQSDPFVIK